MERSEIGDKLGSDRDCGRIFHVRGREEDAREHRLGMPERLQSLLVFA
jgi:hypothetical protein